MLEKTLAAKRQKKSFLQEIQINESHNFWGQVSLPNLSNQSLIVLSLYLLHLNACEATNNVNIRIVKFIAILIWITSFFLMLYRQPPKC